MKYLWQVEISPDGGKKWNKYGQWPTREGARKRAYVGRMHGNKARVVKYVRDDGDYPLAQVAAIMGLYSECLKTLYSELKLSVPKEFDPTTEANRLLKALRKV